MNLNSGMIQKTAAATARRKVDIIPPEISDASDFANIGK